MAEAGKTVSLYFEEKLKELYADQSFPPVPEPEERAEERAEGRAVEDDDDVTEDSDDDFVQPRRKRLKTEEKPMHIK